MPTLSYISVTNALFDQRQEVLDWIASHTSNDAAIDRYEARLQEIDHILDSLVPAGAAATGTGRNRIMGNPSRGQYEASTLSANDFDPFATELEDALAAIAGDVGRSWR